MGFILVISKGEANVIIRFRILELGIILASPLRVVCLGQITQFPLVYLSPPVNGDSSSYLRVVKMGENACTTLRECLAHGMVSRTISSYSKNVYCRVLLIPYIGNFMQFSFIEESIE